MIFLYAFKFMIFVVKTYDSKLFFIWFRVNFLLGNGGVCMITYNVLSYGFSPDVIALKFPSSHFFINLVALDSEFFALSSRRQILKR